MPRQTVTTQRLFSDSGCSRYLLNQIAQESGIFSACLREFDDSKNNIP
ncbi:hypothetical protein PM8797T_13680 [Gimesia maris DSM 8797]|nr:hypothetical protein PM8797T_13680 [Gimesia maris DSM 8797]